MGSHLTHRETSTTPAGDAFERARQQAEQRYADLRGSPDDAALARYEDSLKALSAAALRELRVQRHTRAKAFDAALRVSLSRIRNGLGPEFFLQQDNRLSLSHPNIWIDVEQFDSTSRCQIGEPVLQDDICHFPHQKVAKYRVRE